MQETFVRFHEIVFLWSKNVHLYLHIKKNGIVILSGRKKILFSVTFHFVAKQRNIFNYILLIMLLPLSQFFLLFPLPPAPPTPSGNPHAIVHVHGSCEHSLAAPFPILYFTSLWLLCNYLFVLLNPLISSAVPPHTLPIWQPSKCPLYPWFCLWSFLLTFFLKILFMYF